MTDEEIRDEVFSLNSRVAGLEEENKMLSAVLKEAVQNGEDFGDSRRVLRGHVWKCKRCQAKLGVYDETDDELCIKRRDVIVYITPGDGGAATVVCYGCGLQNRVEGTKA